jgi:zinc transporter ZupT
MQLTPPKKIVWTISLILAIVGIIVEIVALFVMQDMAILPIVAFLLELVAAGLLLAGNALKGF